MVITFNPSESNPFPLPLQKKKEKKFYEFFNFLFLSFTCYGLNTTTVMLYQKSLCD